MVSFLGLVSFFNPYAISLGEVSSECNLLSKVILQMMTSSRRVLLLVLRI